MKDAIIVDNIWKKYSTRQTEIQVLKGVTFSVKERTITCIVGPNGAGKTTLLKIIAGYMKPDQGRILVMGKNPLDINVRASIGYMPQEDILFNSLSFIEHLELLNEIRAIKTDKEFVYKIAGEVGLKHHLSLNVGRLSGGQRRLIQLLLAISHMPKIILLDEPIAFVDRENREIILNVIRMLVVKNHSTVLMASHDMYACSIADKLFELRDGLIRELGSRSFYSL